MWWKRKKVFEYHLILCNVQWVEILKKDAKFEFAKLIDYLGIIFYIVIDPGVNGFGIVMGSTSNELSKTIEKIVLK